jgi:hypothetical protein
MLPQRSFPHRFGGLDGTSHLEDTETEFAKGRTCVEEDVSAVHRVGLILHFTTNHIGLRELDQLIKSDLAEIVQIGFLVIMHPFESLPMPITEDIGHIAH